MELGSQNITAWNHATTK